MYNCNRVGYLDGIQVCLGILLRGSSPKSEDQSASGCFESICALAMLPHDDVLVLLEDAKMAIDRATVLVLVHLQAQQSAAYGHSSFHSHPAEVQMDMISSWIILCH